MFKQEVKRRYTRLWYLRQFYPLPRSPISITSWAPCIHTLTKTSRPHLTPRASRICGEGSQSHRMAFWTLHAGHQAHVSSYHKRQEGAQEVREMVFHQDKPVFSFLTSRQLGSDSEQTQLARVKFQPNLEVCVPRLGMPPRARERSAEGSCQCLSCMVDCWSSAAARIPGNVNSGSLR